MYNNPASIFARVIVASKGITAHAAKAGPIANTGAIKNKYKFDLAGNMTSFNASFSPSAIGCNNPQGPTRLGPIRTWIKPITLRSANVK